MLAALLLHGIMPGPFLLTKHPDLVFTLFAGLILVNLLMIPVGIVILRLCLLALKLDPPVLIASVLALIVIGTYAGDLFVLNPVQALIFGVIGYGMRIWGFSAAAAVLGIVLGVLAESELRRSLIIFMEIGPASSPARCAPVLLFLTLGVWCISSHDGAAPLAFASRGPGACRRKMKTHSGRR
jgi:TctA family transporter